MRLKTPRVSNLDYYREHFLEAIAEDGVVCLECGEIYRSLGTHVLLRHHVSLDEYRTRWGYNRRQSLIARDLVPKFRAQALVRGFPAYGSTAGGWKKGHASIARREGYSAPKQFRLIGSLFFSGFRGQRSRAIRTSVASPDFIQGLPEDHAHSGEQDQTGENDRQRVSHSFRQAALW